MMCWKEPQRSSLLVVPRHGFTKKQNFPSKIWGTNSILGHNIKYLNVIYSHHHFTKERVFYSKKQEGYNLRTNSVLMIRFGEQTARHWY